ncbi:MAG: hypothetical protein EA415_05985 [Sphaerobacteraceae bacterium]|nr:MAG: hypothetical protein EA415_05985 [Sphaerobacteraceae bacterium]
MTAGKNNQHIPIEDLSAYADGETLTSEQRSTIEQHLAHCADCREELAAQQTISALLADLPEPEVPRSFRLTPADVGTNPAPASDPVEIQPWIVRNQSRFRWAGLAAAVLLVMVITADLFSTTGSDDSATEFTTMQESADIEAPAEEERADEPSIMSTDEDAAMDAAEEAAPDAELESAAPEEEEDLPVAEEAPESPEEPTDQPAVELAPDDDAATDDADHPVAGTAEDDAMPGIQPVDETDGGLSLLQWSGIGLALLTAVLLVAGFVLPRVWPGSSQSPR